MKPEVRHGLALTVLMLIWVGLVSIGLSGLVASAMTAGLGPAFVAGDLPGVTYSPGRCTELQEYAPSATTCAEAAAIHHADEVATYRIGVGVLGLGFLAGWGLARRRWPHARVPATLAPAAGAAAFGVVGLALLALALSAAAQGLDTGVGGYLSAAAISLPVSVVFGLGLYRILVAWPVAGGADDSVIAAPASR